MRRGALIGLLLGVVLVGCDDTTPVDNDMVALRAGVASATVSPEPGSFIAGDARDRRFTGEHDPLFAKAVVLHDGSTGLAVVAIDNIGLTRPDVQAIQDRAAARIRLRGLTAERIVVSSTHTHSGPDVVGLWGEHELASGRDPAYMEFLIETAAAQVVAAASQLRPVTATVASADVPFDWVHNVTEPGLLDPRLTVLRLIAADGSTLATLTNHACHPTVLDAVFDQVSADYVGGFYRQMEAALGGEHLFLQGAIGGWVQPVQRVPDPELADRYGAALADATLDLLVRERVVGPARIGFARQVFDIPLENPGFEALLDAGVLERELHDGAVRTEVLWFALGSVQFATHPGESSPAHSLATREWMSARDGMVLGLAQDALGYILPPEYFEADTALPSAGYLAATSVGPEAGPRMLAALEDVIAEGQAAHRARLEAADVGADGRAER